jgi:hypothetical protein
MAASECGLGSEVGQKPSALNKASHDAYGPGKELDGVDLKAYPSTDFPSAATMGTVSFGIFSGEAKTCDQQIDQEEILLCAAERLASLADSEVPVTWVGALRGITGMRDDVTTADIPGIFIDEEYPPIVFPVLDPKTKFIVRDLALQALSYIPLLDSRPHDINGTNYSCSELYAAAPGLAAGTPRDSAYDKLYNTHANPGAAGTAFYPPIETWPPTAKRLDHVTQVLRAAGQLTKDLIEKSVDSDLAAAADKVAGLTPEERIQALWVAPNDPFNSMAHAARGPRTLRSSGDRRF